MTTAELVKHHIVISSDGVGPVIHADDLGDITGRFYAGGSIDGLPVRLWYPEATMSRINKDREDVVRAGKKAKHERNS